MVLNGYLKAAEPTKSRNYVVDLILTLNNHADDQAGLWVYGGAGLYTG